MFGELGDPGLERDQALEQLQGAADDPLEGLRFLHEPPIRPRAAFVSELRARLEKKAFRPLTQRIGADFHLRPLDAAEAADYVRHRLAVAGGAPDLFAPAAIERLHQAAAGIPRVLNHLATQALLEAMARGLAAVDEASAAAAAQSQGFRAVERPAPVVVEGRRWAG